MANDRFVVDSGLPDPSEFLDVEQPYHPDRIDDVERIQLLDRLEEWGRPRSMSVAEGKAYRAARKGLLKMGYGITRRELRRLYEDLDWHAEEHGKWRKAHAEEFGVDDFDDLPDDTRQQLHEANDDFVDFTNSRKGASERRHVDARRKYDKRIDRIAKAYRKGQEKAARIKAKEEASAARIKGPEAAELRLGDLDAALARQEAASNMKLRAQIAQDQLDALNAKADEINRGLGKAERQATSRISADTSRWLDNLLGKGGYAGSVGPAPSVAEDAAIYAPRRAAAKTALKGIGGGALGLGTDWMMAYNEGARDVDDWMSQEEENITQMIPGLVSPSELPPPAVLSDERRQAVTATQGMAGVGPDFESAPVTEQEIRAFISNRMASGRPLPPWAEAITSRGPDGRARIEPRVLRRPPQRPVAPPPAAPQQSSVPMELRRR